MATNRTFDAVLIDFYGTICAGDRAAVEATCAVIIDQLQISMTPGALAVRWGERFFPMADGSNHHDFKNLHQCEVESLRLTLADLGFRRVDPVPFVARLEAYWSDPPLHADALEVLPTIDRPICCVSNADSAHLLTAIAKHGLSFSAVVCSEDVRCYKPRPEIFQHALKLLGAAPERVLHVGDSLHSDVGGASKLGISTVWICREDRIHDIGTSAADHTIRSLAELPGLLAG